MGSGDKSRKRPVSTDSCYAAHNTEERDMFWPRATMYCGAAGRGDRLDLGASCPSVSMVPGVSDHNTGDTLRRDPAWETASVPVAPAPAALVDIPCSAGWRLP